MATRNFYRGADFCLCLPSDFVPKNRNTLFYCKVTNLCKPTDRNEGIYCNGRHICHVDKAYASGVRV